MSKTIAIVGLGLIGGSMAMALQGFEDYEVVGVDVSQPTLRFAVENHVADRVTDDAAGDSRALSEKLTRSSERKRRMNRAEAERNK